MSAVTHKPDLRPAEVRHWLRENYAIDGSLEPLPGESDLNFKCRLTDGRQVVCKISSDLGNLEALTAQHEVLALLNRRDMVAVPDVLTSGRGESLVPLHAESGVHIGRVLTFVPGTVLAKCEPGNDRLFRDLGRTVGLIDHALEEYRHPALHYKFDWDLAHAVEVVERHRDLIADPRVREGVDRVHHNFVEFVVPRFGQLRKSVIHNDANDYNVLVEGDEVTGLIDFGDMVHTYTICDLAIAMAYAVLEADDVLEVVRQMTMGYHESMPIEEVELEVVFPMMLMRLAVSACMAAHQMQLSPGNAYLSVSQEPIRKTLGVLLALDGQDVHRLLKESLE